MGTLVAAIAVIGVLWVIVTEVGRGNWQFLEWLNPLECCSFFAVFGITSVVTIGGFLLWHSLLVAALAGGSIMTLMLLVLAVFAASYKAESQSSSSRCAGMGAGVRPR